MAKIPESDPKEFRQWASRYLDDQWADRGMPTSIYQRYCWAAENLCESPIERRMLAGLMFCNFGYFDEPNIILQADEAERTYGFGGWRGAIVPQAILKNTSYRVDFLVVLNDSIDGRMCSYPAFIVECDGHDFHERTKEQAQRDRKRDRDIQKAGYPILRFTGSEIYRDLDDCISQIDSFGTDMLEKEWFNVKKT